MAAPNQPHAEVRFSLLNLKWLQLVESVSVAKRDGDTPWPPIPKPSPRPCPGRSAAWIARAAQPTPEAVEKRVNGLGYTTAALATAPAVKPAAKDPCCGGHDHDHHAHDHDERAHDHGKHQHGDACRSDHAHAHDHKHGHDHAGHDH